MTERPQQQYARVLHSKLVSLLGSTYPEAEIAISGAGVHWQCTVQTGRNTSVVHCFGQWGPEYLTIFQRGGEEIATARTPSSDETADAILLWLTRDSLPALYNRFPFVDQRKRELILIRDGIVGFAPELRDYCELQEVYSSTWYLWFRMGSRSTLINFNGKEQDPDVICHWDECALFDFRVSDRSVLAPVLKRWLCDKAMPSAMRKEFSWLTIGELADYYESGNPTEGEFIDSWNQIERFYKRFRSNEHILRLIDELRRNGYDRRLRAGQSLSTFILSRSRRHGLRDDQARIHLQCSFTDDDAMIVALKTNKDEDTFSTVTALSDQLTTALNKLLECPID